MTDPNKKISENKENKENEKIISNLEEIVSQLKEIGKSVKSDKYFKYITTGFLILLASISAYSAFFQIPSIAESIKKPQVEVTVEPYVENNYIPIKIMNLGNEEAKNVTIHISSCYINKSIPYDYYRVYPGETKLIQFTDKETIDNFNKLNCMFGTDINLSAGRVNLPVYRHKITGQMYSPTINETIDVCGYCFWTINITASNMNPKTIRQYTYSTVQLKASVPGFDIDFEDPNLEKIGTLGMILFDYKTARIMGIG